VIFFVLTSPPIPFRAHPEGLVEKPQNCSGRACSSGFFHNLSSCNSSGFKFPQKPEKPREAGSPLRSDKLFHYKTTFSTVPEGEIGGKVVKDILNQRGGLKPSATSLYGLRKSGVYERCHVAEIFRFPEVILVQGKDILNQRGRQK
jgi:hypothetical protein